MHTKLRKYPFMATLISAALLMLTSCHVTRYVQPGEYLLQKAVTVKGAKDLDLSSAIKTKPNRRMISPKLYLSIHNFGTTLSRDSSLLKRLFPQKPQTESIC